MAYLDSLIGYTTGVISDPSITKSDSPIGFAVGTISDPAASLGDSPIGYSLGNVIAPMMPIAVMTSSGIAYVPLKIKT